MHLLVDIRALMHGHRTGVELYISHVLEEIIPLLNNDDFITLWYNSAQEKNSVVTSYLPTVLPHPQVRLLHTTLPNKLFHGLCLLPFPHLFEWFLKRYGKMASPPSCIFIPDPRPFPTTSIPLVSTFHDLSPLEHYQGYRLPTRLWHWCTNIKGLARRSQHLISVSHFTKKRMLHHFDVPAERISVVYEAPILDEAPSSVPLIPTPYFVALGTQEPRKRLAYTIELFLKWNAKQKTPYTLVIVGGQNSQIFKEVPHSKDSHIVYTNYVSEADKSTWIAHAHALLYLSSYEGFGLPPLEAMTLGTPPIVASTSAPAEIVQEGGIIVPEDNASIFEALNFCASNSEEYKNLCQKAEVRSSYFSWHQCAKETLAILRSNSFF